MDRRTFLKGSAGVGAFGALHLTSGGFASVFGQNPSSASDRAAAADNGRILVVLRLDGGNDGLNTVLPLDQYDNLAKARSNILIPASKALRLDARTGLHPAMTGIHKAFLDGKIRIVQAVGYPNHNQSHFRSTDIWFTGSDSNKVLESGVLGRYLDGQFPNYPNGYPNTNQPHPPAIQIGSTLLTLLQGADTGMGMAISDPSNVYALSSNGTDTAPDGPAGHELTFLRQMASETRQYGDAIKAAMASATNRSSLYPATGNNLANQFKAVARLIAGGLRTRIYVLSLGGFDTHSAQVTDSDTTAGKHADLLRQMSEAIAAFLDDLKLLGLDQRVVGLTVSEFGRRILSNASLGTDHGMAAPMFLFGDPIMGGISGANPAIPDTVTSQNNIAMQYDFRSIYSTLIRHWLEVDSAELKRVMLQDFPVMDLLDGYNLTQGAPFVEFDLQVNHADGRTNFAYSIEVDSPVSLVVYDLHGKAVRTLVKGVMTAGPHLAAMETTALLPGLYVARMQVGSGRQDKAFHVLR